MSTTLVPATTDKNLRAARPRPLLDYAIFFLCSILYLLPFMRIIYVGTDEGTLLAGAVRIAHGQIFARDFFEVMGPGSFYWLALFFKLFGVTFFASRICLFITSLGTYLLIYFLSRQILKKNQWVPLLLVAASYFGSSWPGISHHVDSNFFALCSVASLALWKRTENKLSLVLAGAMAAATTFTLQPKGILLILASVTWLIIEYRKDASFLSMIGFVGAGYVLVLGTGLFYFWSQGGLRDLIDANVIWPSHHYLGINGVPYGQGLIEFYWKHWTAAAASYFWGHLIAAILITPFLFIAGLPALLVSLGIFLRKRIVHPILLLYVLCGSAIWISELHRRDIYHLVMASPLLIIVCIYFVGEIPGKAASNSLKLLTMSSICLAALNCVLTFYAKPVSTPVGPVHIPKQFPVLTYLNQHVSPGEQIFIYPYFPGLYFLTGTSNPTRYSLLVYNYTTREQYDDVIRTLEQRKVRTIVWETSFYGDLAPLVFPEAMQKPAGGYVIEPYLEQHYKTVWSDSDFRILERKD